ncbi:MAG: D-alanyl-D-alanine carboxypeptidase/D-alanyl-D-alanine-endopeptidase [Arenicellales bacterium]
MSKRLILAFLLALQWAPAPASTPLPSGLRAALDRFQVPDADLGLYIAPVDGGSHPITLNPLKPFNPGSVMKLLPSIAALESLTPAYQWSTGIYTTGRLAKGVLHGDLYIKGGGDPYLTVESVWAMLRAVRGSGIRRIAGNIVVDDHIFDLPHLDRAEFDDKPYRIYNGPANGLLVNFWAVRFTITALADEVHIDAFPDSRRLRIVNHIRRTDSSCRPSTRYVAYRVDTTRDAVVVDFDGVLSTRCPPVIMTRAVIPSDRYLAYVLPGLWRSAGGTLAGTVTKGSVPDDAEKIYTHSSRTLAEVVRATDKFSNNLMARNLLLTLGTLYKDSDVTVGDGVKALDDWLLSRGIDVPGLKVVNGAGLSRDARISARGLANVLRAGFHSRFAPEFLSAFPIAGEDWALEDRDFDESIPEMVRMKTGLLDDVRGMGGYITSRSGKTYITVLLVNHKGIQNQVGTRMQNAVIRYVLGL